MGVLSRTELSERELAVLEERWLKNPEALEAKLIRAYLAMNQCWHCSADLNPEEHPRCYDCPEWRPTGDEEDRGDGQHS
jgi:hypothetical protein